MENIIKTIEENINYIVILLGAICIFAKFPMFRKDKKISKDFSLEGMCAGMLIGTVVSVAVNGEMLFYMSIGILVGMIIGLFIKK